MIISAYAADRLLREPVMRRPAVLKSLSRTAEDAGTESGTRVPHVRVDRLPLVGPKREQVMLGVLCGVVCVCVRALVCGRQVPRLS